MRADTFFTDADLTTNSGWQAYLREVEVLWRMEGREGYYYGVVELPAGSAWGGVGYVNGTPVSVGGMSADTYAHELGHNMTLRHCSLRVVPVRPIRRSRPRTEASGNGGTTSSSVG